MRSSILIDKTGRGLRCLALVLLFLAVIAASPIAALADDITVNGKTGSRVGKLPWIITTFVTQPPDSTVLPGHFDSYVFALFDTGSQYVAFDKSTGETLGFTYPIASPYPILNIRINGLGNIDPGTLNAPKDASLQAEVPTIAVRSNPYTITLIGGPVTSIVTAVIDYTKIVMRGPFDYFKSTENPDGNVDGPDITCNPTQSYTPKIVLSLQLMPSHRYYMHNVSFNGESTSVTSPAEEIDPQTSSARFEYDTGTTVTLVTQDLAAALGLTGTGRQRDFTTQMSDDPNATPWDGYYLKSITMTGEEGTYTVNDAPVTVSPISLGLGIDAIIGSNLFSQVRLLFDGPNATLGIDKPPANNPPVANAGADQVIEATGPTTSFTLDGTSSTYAAGDTITYSWKDANSNVVGTTSTVTLSRALGTYIFTLTVTDPGGLTSDDSVSITIHDTTPPSLKAPPDVTVSESNPLGTPVNLGQPTVSDICDPAPTVTNDALALYPLGVTTVTWTATDHSGNASSATQKVTVVPGDARNQLSNLAKLINYSVASGGIASEMQTSLLAKINAATAALVQGNPNATKVAMQDLKALVNQIEAQTDKKINPAVAAALISRANLIIATLGG